MRRAHSLRTAAVLAICALPSALSAQIPGNLDWPALPGGSSVGVATDWANGLNQDSGEAMYAGVRLSVARPSFTVWGGAGYFGMRSGLDNDVTGGAGVAYHVIAPERGMTLSAEGGAGYAKVAGTNVVGATAGLTVSHGADALRPFLRAHAIMTRAAGLTDFGVSSVGGAELRLSPRVGVQAGLQWEKIEDSNAVALGGGLRLGL